MSDPFSPARLHDPLTCTCRGSQVSARSLVGILGPPPQAFDGVLSGLLRAHRHVDADDEQRGRDGYHANRERDAVLRALTELAAWLRPSVEAEKAAWDAQDRADEEAKEASWQQLRAAGLSEAELAARSGTG